MRKTDVFLLASAMILASLCTPIGAYAAGHEEEVLSQQAPRKVTANGVVVDEKGETVPGVTIMILGTQQGTTTDMNGKFSLPVPAGSELQFSFMGYVTTRQVAGKNMMIRLEPEAQSLDEVVVVGYGSLKARNVTGSVAVVRAEELEAIPVSNFGEALEGKMPGVSVDMGSYRPGSSADISIRQSFSLSKDGGSSIPLVIIDDVIQLDPETGNPTLETMNALDVNEVESLTILRDGSAAIYGPRASQGAIIIKTKRGKAGKVRVNYSGSFAVNDAVSHSKVMNSYQYGQWVNRLFAPGITDDKYATSNNIFSDEELEKMKSLNYDWLDKAWSSAFVTRQSVNVSGGSENVTYFAGATYYSQTANLGSMDYDKWNFRVGVDAKLAEGLKMSMSLAANESDVIKPFTKFMGTDGYCKGSETDYSVLLHMPQYIPWEYDTNGDGINEWVSPMMQPGRKGGTNNNTACSWNYFAIDKSGSQAESKNTGYDVNMSMSYDLPWVKGLSVKGSYAKRYSMSTNEQYQNQWTLYQPQNTYTQGSHLIDENTTWKINQIKRSARVLYDKEYATSYQANFTVNYHGEFNGHSISAMATVEKTENEQSLSRMIYENTAQNFYTGSSISAGDLSTDNSYMYPSESGSLSYVGRADYSYKDKYMLSFICRYDASTKFASENRWGFFPGISAGWVVSEEDFFNSSVIDFLKIRASVGLTGKDNVKAWKWKQNYDYAAAKGLFFGDGTTATYGGALTQAASPNRNMTWDKTTKYNLGVDAKMLNNRLSAGLDMYYDHTTDMLIALTNGVPISVGGTLAEENYAGIDAYGFELSLGWNDKIGDVKYGVSIHTGWGDNRVKKYAEAAINHPWSGNLVEGKSTDYGKWGYSTWKGNEKGDGVLRTQADIDNYWAYLEENRAASGAEEVNYLGIKAVDGMRPGMLAYRDIRGALKADGTYAAPDGTIQSGFDYVRLAKKTKTHGFTTHLNAGWKGVAFSTQIATYWGGWRGIEYIKQGTGSSNFMWAQPVYLNNMFDAHYNPNGKYPNMYDASYNNAPSDFWEVSTFRCYVKNLSISYTLPKEWLQKVKLNAVKLTLSGNNLWDFYNPYPSKYRNMYDSFDAEYPTLRTWSFGINVTL